MSFFLFCSFLFKKRVFVKIVQTECNQVLLELLRCRQSYVKIVQTECKMSSLLGYFTEVPTILCKDTKKPIYIGMKLPKLFKISNLSIKIKVFAFFILYCARLALSSLLRQDKLRFGNKNESFMTFVLYCARLALSLHNLCKTNYG